jgi:RNA polymerase subunit RPABC4/transcription elongation factor Spt4
MTAGLALVYKLSINRDASAEQYPELTKYLPPSEGTIKRRAAEVARLAKATARWVAAGCPTRTEAEVRQLFYEACRPCQHYRVVDKDNGLCKLCGCRVNAEKWLNKLLWATESCPEDPPRFVATVGPKGGAEGHG